MKKVIFISIIILALISCNKENVTEPFNYEQDTPVWLKEKIDTMSFSQEYMGTQIFRHEWNLNQIYHIVIPISSCGSCNVYDKNGIKVQFSDEGHFQNYLNNRKKEVLVWEWKN